MTAQQTSTRTLVPTFLSRKIKTLNFFTIVCVILIHAYNYTDTFLQPTTMIAEGLHIPAMLEFFLSNALTRFANPLFFAISGYLFFVGVQQFTVGVYVEKVKKRAISLLTPYIFWVFFWTFVGYLILQTTGGANFPLITEKFANWESESFSCLYNAPLSFQFWFIKDLFKLVLLTPFIYFLVKNLKSYAVLLLFIPWLMDFTFPHMPNCDGLIAFTLGAHIAINGIDKKSLAKPVSSPKWLVIPTLWIVTCVVYSYLSATAHKNNISPYVLLLVYKACVILGFVSISVLYDFTHRKQSVAKESAFVSGIKNSSFMIFCIHEPLQHFIFQACVTSDTSDVVHLLLYFGLPISFVILGVFVNQFLMKVSPTLHHFLTGNR